MNEASRKPSSASFVGPAILLGVVAAGAVGCVDAREDASETAGAIIGDQLANDEHPEVVRLTIQSATAGVTAGWSCTGTLVAGRTILTARHCLADAIGEGGACAGLAWVDTSGLGADGSVAYRFERCATSDLGRVAYWTNDIAFVRLEQSVIGVAPARLARETPRADRFTTYGYGDHGSGSLLGGCVRESDGNKRKLVYEGRLGMRLGQATCPGDSGGPHFIGTSNVIAGITSGGFLGVDVNATVFTYAEELARQIAAFER